MSNLSQLLKSPFKKEKFGNSTARITFRCPKVEIQSRRDGSNRCKNFNNVEELCKSSEV